MADSSAASEPSLAPARDAAKLRTQVRIQRWWSEIARLLVAACPIFVIGVLNMGMSIADMLMLGRYDAEGLASIVVISDLYSIVFNFSAGFAGVVTPQVAAALGARVRWQVCTIVRRTLLLVTMLGAAGAFVLVVSGQALEALAATKPGAAGAYAACMAATYVFMLLFALVRAVLSAVARPGVALLVILAALPAKVAANYVLIHGALGVPALGTMGAGLSSLLVAALMGGTLLLYLFRSPTFREFDTRPSQAAIDPPMFTALARSGLLLGLIAVSETGAFLASTIVIGLFTPQELIAHVLAFRTLAVFYLVIAGFGQAATIRMAYLYGRAATSLQLHATRAIASCALVLVTVILVLFVTGAEPLGRLLAGTVQGGDELAASVAHLLRLAGMTLAALVPAHMITALLRAQDDVAVPTGLTMMSYWGVAFTSMLMLAVGGKGAEAAWYSLMAGSLISSVSFGLYICRSPVGCALRTR